MQYEGNPTHFSVTIDEFDKSYVQESLKDKTYMPPPRYQIPPSHVYVNLEVDSIHFL